MQTRGAEDQTTCLAVNGLHLPPEPTLPQGQMIHAHTGCDADEKGRHIHDMKHPLSTSCDFGQNK